LSGAPAGARDLRTSKKGAHVNDLSAGLQDSALTLLVARVWGANHPHHTVTPDNFAVAAHLLDRSSHFHRKLL